MNCDRALRSITDLIVQCCDPDEIVLFGSRAKGNDQPGSDLDILVIGAFREAKALRGQELKGRLRQFPIHVDLLLVTPEELEAAGRNPYGFFSTIQRNSKTVYKK